MDNAFPAPRLLLLDDEDAILAVAAAAIPGSLTRETAWEPNGLYVWANGDPAMSTTRREAALRYQCLLGVLRAFWHDAGELEAEHLTGLGPGSSRNRAGAQWISVPSITLRPDETDKLENFAGRAGTGLACAKHLESALILNGRPSRTSADYFLIHEYACLEFATEQEIHDHVKLAGKKVRGGGALLRVEAELGIPALAQLTFYHSANNLPALQGGRHAGQRYPVTMTLDKQREFAADLLSRWVETFPP